MTQQEAVYRDVVGEVESATQAVRKIGGEDRAIWNLKFKVAAMSQYALTTSMALECAAQVMQGEGVNARLMRGRLNNAKDGQPYAGDKDWHYWWEVAYWNGVANPLLGPAPQNPAPQQAPARPPQGAPASASAPPPQQSTGFPPDDKFRTKEELRWTEAWKMAVRMANVPHFDINDIDGLLAFAKTVNSHLEAVPEPYCARHDTEYSETSPKTGKKYHLHTYEDGSQAACIYGGGIVPIPPKQQPAPPPAPAPEPPPAPPAPPADRDVDDLPW